MIRFSVTSYHIHDIHKSYLPNTQHERAAARQGAQEYVYYIISHHNICTYNT